jgi:hypothetical protein
VPAGGLHAAAGFGDGSFRVGKIGLESTFLDAEDLPAGTGSLASGGAIATEDGAIVRGGDRYARLRLVTELGAASSVAVPAASNGSNAPLSFFHSHVAPLCFAADARGGMR